MNSTAPEFAPIQNGEKRLDLAIVGDESVIELSTWTDGLGWCVQKTMKLDEGLLAEMHNLIGAARIRMRNRRMDREGAVENTPRILHFPAIS